MSVATPVDKSGQKIRTMFGAIAGWYDFLNHFLSLGIDIWWRKKTVELVAPQGAAPILDVCTGTRRSGDCVLACRRSKGACHRGGFHSRNAGPGAIQRAEGPHRRNAGSADARRGRYDASAV